MILAPIGAETVSPFELKPVFLLAPETGIRPKAGKALGRHHIFLVAS
jgi:hypothetical protein